ncbi:MAG: four helix bundle protein [Firmicutes bacterium]|nr:four helix bundle protein [Bacillota bacterium]
MQEKVVQEKSKKFAIRIVRLYEFLARNEKERVMAKQILRSGTSIGANIAEGDYAVSKADFICKSHIALKEASETRYWLDLLFETSCITKEQYDNLFFDCDEIIKILASILKTAKTNKMERE